MKTLGMIGGTSWFSTVEYYRYINEMVGERTGTPPQNPPLLLYSQNLDLMRRENWDEINETYLNTSVRLQQAGAEAIIICANTPHKVYPFVQPKIDIPILHIADATAGEAKKLGLCKLTLLGTRPTMEFGFIKDRLKDEHEIDTLVPDQEGREEVHRVVSEELTRGEFKKESKQYYLDQMAKLKEQGADGVILGCTEIPLLVQPEDFDQPLLNTTYLHAQMAVDFILGT